MKKFTLLYYPWITQSIQGRELNTAINGFASLFEIELRAVLGNDYKVEVANEMQVPKLMDELKPLPAGEVAGKIGLLNPIGYAALYPVAQHVTSIGVVRRKYGNGSAGATYATQIYVNRKSAIKELETREKTLQQKQMLDRRMVFGNRQSTSNFLVPAYMLHKHGLHPLTSFKSVEFAGGHDTAAIAVYEGKADIGAGHDGVIVDLASKAGYGDADHVLVRIAWSDAIPSDPIVANIPDAEICKGVAKALLATAPPIDDAKAAKEGSGNEAVKKFWGTEFGFESIDPSQYAPLLGFAKALSLDVNQMMRRT